MNSIASPFTTGDLGHKQTSQGFIFGISFTRRNGRSFMAPYACFYYMDKISSEEAEIIYSFGVVRVKGRNMETIYDLVHRHELVAVWCVEGGQDETENNQRADIHFEKFRLGEED